MKKVFRLNPRLRRCLIIELQDEFQNDNAVHGFV